MDAFFITVDTLRELCTRLRAEFGEDVDVSVSAELRLSEQETITFDPVSEAEELSLPRKGVRNFGIDLSSEGRSFRLDTKDAPQNLSVTSFSGEEGWCVAVNEVAVSFLRNHRVWYFWLARPAVWWSLVAILAVASFAGFVFLGNPLYSLVSYAAMGMGIFKNRILPPAKIAKNRTRAEILPFLTLAMVTLGTLAAIVSAIMAILERSSE